MLFSVTGSLHHPGPKEYTNCAQNCAREHPCTTTHHSSLPSFSCRAMETVSNLLEAEVEVDHKRPQAMAAVIQDVETFDRLEGA